MLGFDAISAQPVSTLAPSAPAVTSASTLSTQRNVLTEATIWQKTQKGSLVVSLTTYYNFAADLRRKPQAKIFGGQDGFAFRSTVLVDPSAPAYNPATDLPRRKQARIFSGTEPVFAKFSTQLSPDGVTPPPYSWQTDVARKPQTKFFGEADVFVRPNLPRALLINGKALESSDIFNGQDTVGWYEPDLVWSPAVQMSRIVLDSFTPTPPPPVVVQYDFVEIRSFTERRRFR